MAAAILLCMACVAAWPVQAGKIAWPATGPFEACLDEAAEQWLGQTAEAVVLGEDSAKALDDIKVALWTIGALKACSSKGKPAHADSEALFGKHMAHWRQHIYDLASAIRAKGGSD